MSGTRHEGGLPLAAAAVYGASLLQGLAMVSFPASGTFLKSRGFSDADYGLIFLPQLVTTIVGSLVGGGLAQRLGLGRLLAVALGATLLSQAALASVAFLPGSPLPPVLIATGLFGLGFGLAAAPLNTVPGLLFPQRGAAAVVALHTVLGGGLALGPVLAARFIEGGRWSAFPGLLMGLSALLATLALVAPIPARAESSATTGTVPEESPLRSVGVWIFAAMVVLYAFAEGTFANWSVIYLSEERGLALDRAQSALSAFWAAMSIGRLLVAALLLRMPAGPIWLAFPVLMLAAFVGVSRTGTPGGAIALFAFAGLACSAFFPVTMGLATRRFAADAPLVSSLMIAALMTGVGIGSFVIGPLRASLRLADLYLYSAAYPAGALALALLLVGRGDVRLREKAQA